MRVAVSGAGGLIGGALVRALRAGNDEVLVLQRRPTPVPQGVRATPWPVSGGDPRWAEGLRGIDAIVHLAGSPIAAGRWNAATKAEILASRQRATQALIQDLHRAGVRPQAFLCASAVGYYGPSGDEPLDEASPPGQDFLARVCVAWERAAEGASVLGARVVRLRTGVVLAPGGGMLARLLPFFRLGLGGPVGSGRQWLPWIALEDEVEIIRTLLNTPDAEGAFNLTAQAPVRSQEFARVLGRVLHRPAALPLPAPLVRLAFGEMGEAVLLSGQRALPRHLLALPYRFRQEDLAETLAACV